MGLREDAKILGECYQQLKHSLDCNFQLLDIYEGNLMPYVLDSLRQQLSPKAFDSCRHRVPAINLLKRLVDKLSTIYNKTPDRIVGGTTTDQEMWDWYVEMFKLDVQMQLSNEYFNIHKACALEPYLDFQFAPKLRIIPADRFFVYSNDKTDPLRVTHFVKVMGVYKVTKYHGKEQALVDKVILYAYTDTEFLVIDEDGDVVDEIMRMLGSDGTHNYGRIPYTYMNRSKTKIFPKSDTDLLSMTKLVPVMITDVNYAMMYQSFSIFYGIDVDADNIELNPNAFLSLKSDPASGKDPKFGQIKPDVDSDKAINSIKEQLSLWLQSRNIRPGGAGQSDTSLSALSKMVDEMDTTSERQKQIPSFVEAETDLFNLVAHHMHPLWILNPSFEIKTTFTKDSEMSVKFPEQIINKSKKELLDETVEELKNGLLSRQSAMRRLNPELTDEQLQLELQQIDVERTVTIDQGPDQDGDEASEIQS